jgi:hypothetical protein
VSFKNVLLRIPRVIITFENQSKIYGMNGLICRSVAIMWNLVNLQLGCSGLPENADRVLRSCGSFPTEGLSVRGNVVWKHITKRRLPS